MSGEEQEKEEEEAKEAKEEGGDFLLARRRNMREGEKGREGQREKERRGAFFLGRGSGRGIRFGSSR